MPSEPVLPVGTVAIVGSAVRLYLEPLAFFGGPERELRSFFRTPSFAARSINRDLAQWRRLLKQSGSADFRYQLESAVAWANVTSEELRRSTSGTQLQYQLLAQQWEMPTSEGVSPRPNYYHSSIARALKASAGLMALLTAAIGTALAMMSFSLDVVGAIVVGVGGAAFAVASGAALGTGIVTTSVERPKRALDVLVRWSTILLVAQLGAFGALMVVRGSPGAPPEIALAGVTTLAITTPVLAGMLQAAARLFSWSGDLAVEFQYLQRLALAVAELRDYAASVLARNAESSGAALPRRAIQLNGEL